MLARSERSSRERLRLGALGLVLAGFVGLLGVLAPGARAASGQYVALGDSYTAGPLIPPPNPDFPGCIKSLNNYPHLVAKDRHLPLSDVSCSGAKTDDMTHSQDVDPNPDPPPQFSALKSNTKVVSFTIGGNDIGFSEISQKCASTTGTDTPCQKTYVHGNTDEISDRIKKTAPKVAAVIAGIHERAPNAAVYVLNYLPILPDDQPKWTIDDRASGHGCWPTVPVSDGDAAYVVAKEKELNQMLADQVAADPATNKAKLVDAYSDGVGHDACQLPGTRWVEPEVAPVGAAPLHPNLDGMKGYAKALEGKLQ
jgi:lysophospholipase L1-like esterase